MVRFVRYGKLFRLYEMLQPYLKYSLPLEENLPGERVLAVAPHPDDEAIGCGGSLYMHARSGKPVDIVYCTLDGETREREAHEAASRIGARDTVFLRYCVESLGRARGFPDRLASVLEEKKPDIVFLPFWFDNHTDHRALNSALIEAGARRRFDFLVYAYPVWFPLHPNVLADISGVWEQKKEIISCYRSQLATRDYISMSHSLGSYWASVKGRGLSIVESFFKATFREYVSLGIKIFGSRRFS